MYVILVQYYRLYST